MIVLAGTGGEYIVFPLRDAAEQIKTNISASEYNDLLEIHYA